MILTEQEQIDTLRSKCENAQYRIWIASPFIGSLKNVQKIIGGKWRLPSINCKILTDIKGGFIKKDTFDEFMNNQVEIRHLLSLHAKIYIIDDWCLVTSANLTGTAFLCRYEMGSTSEKSKELETIFDKWWNLGTTVTTLPQKPNKALLGYEENNLFKKMFKAPAYNTAKQDKYDALCEKYKDFAFLYEKITGRNQQMVKDGYTLMQEIDYLFNFLYHDHPDIPSNRQIHAKSLTNNQKEKAIKRYFNDMKLHYQDKPQYWRLQRTKTIQQLLSPKRLSKLNWNDANEVVSCLHCLSSYPINRTKFLNPENNNIDEIRECWNTLLHTGDITSDKIKQVTSKLCNFGLSSVYELIGWYYPDKYPIINNNSNCGMRFFGYIV